MIVVLHGGKVRSKRPVRPWQAAVLRMIPFARDLGRSGGPRGVAVVRVRYRLRGWNGDGAAAISDARYVLAAVREAFGEVPIVVVGHSLGGRVALRCADERSVVGVVGLAPWIGREEPLAQLAGTRLLVLHGDRDRSTDPRASRAYVEAALGIAASAAYVDIEGDGHGMLRRRRIWELLTAGFALRTLFPGELPAPSMPEDSASPGMPSKERWETNTSQAALTGIFAGQVFSSVRKE